MGELSLKILKYVYKSTPDNPEKLEMLFLEMYILKISGGGGVQDPPPRPPLDPRLRSLINCSPPLMGIVLISRVVV